MKTDVTPKLQNMYSSLYFFFGPQQWWPADSSFEVAVGAILTQNTTWKNVEKAIQNLKNEKMLSAKAIYLIPLPRLAELIRPAGYFNIKSERLKNFIRFLMEEYGGSMKRMSREKLTEIRKKLLSIKGIGPETADSIILYGLQMPIFVIDTYTKRVLSRHNILSHNDKYEKYQELFHAELRKDTALFKEYHALLVRLAKEFCRTNPCCRGCPLEGI